MTAKSLPIMFKSVCSSNHKQSVPTCMNKSINNHVQAGQLNHVQACQQAKTSLVDRLVDKYCLSTVFFLFIGTSDSCNPNPCQNSGTCSSDSDTPTGFMCHCPAGWNGTTCQGTVLIPG